MTDEEDHRPHLEHLRRDLSKTQRKRFRDVEWGKRHVDAFRDTGALLLLADKPLTQEQALVFLFAGWMAYADAHKDRYGSGIGQDGVLGEHWEAIGEDMRGLLNGELGRLDAGTLDTGIVAAMKREGLNR